MHAWSCIETNDLEGFASILPNTKRKQIYMSLLCYSYQFTRGGRWKTRQISVCDPQCSAETKSLDLILPFCVRIETNA